MAKKYAVRNLNLCTKDCLCLYVCPTGASDTENSIIDVTKCIGCGACLEACPSKAISLVPHVYPKAQVHEPSLVKKAHNLTKNKALEESLTLKEDNVLLKAINISTRLVNEDLFRELGYMLPQSKNSHELLTKLKSNNLPKEALALLLEISTND